MDCRYPFIAFALFLTCPEHAVGQAAALGDQKTPFTMGISLRGGTVKPGSEVQLTVDLTNTSPERISLWRSRTGPPPYTIQIFDRAGKAVPMTTIGRALRNGDAAIREKGNKPPRAIVGTGSWVSIAPGETVKDWVSIEDQFDLSQPGTYTIQLERIDPATKLLVKSNTVTLTVAN